MTCGNRVKPPEWFRDAETIGEIMDIRVVDGVTLVRVAWPLGHRDLPTLWRADLLRRAGVSYAGRETASAVA